MVRICVRNWCAPDVCTAAVSYCVLSKGNKGIVFICCDQKLTDCSPFFRPNGVDTMGATCGVCVQLQCL